MQDDLNLKDARGYRSKYINRLNDAVKETRIVGGDVEPVVTEAGTLLKIPANYNNSRFKLFAGVAPINGELYNVRAVSDGCFFVSGQFVKLKNAVNTYYAKGGLMPRVSGWYSGTAPASSWYKCDVIIFSFNAEYYLAFRYDDMELYRLVDGATQADEELFEVLVTIGTFNQYQDKIEQFVGSDIYYGGGTSQPVVKEWLPWEIFSTVEDGETVWWVVHPQWLLDKPYKDYPASAVKPTPEYLNAFEVEFPLGLAKYINGVYCWRIDDVKSTIYGDVTDFTKVYAVLTPLNGFKLLLPPADFVITETPACVLIGTFTRDSNGNIEKWTQLRKGAISSIWYETEPFFVEPNCDQSVTRRSAAPIGLEEGTQMQQYSFWLMETRLGDSILKRGEQLNFDENNPQFPYPQYALLYGNWIWRYRLHYREADNTLIKDERTTPTENVEVKIFAEIIEQPYVDRIQVVYPETPIDQGSVDAITGKIKVLAVEINQTDSAKTLFKTEVINATEGGIIEVTQ